MAEWWTVVMLALLSCSSWWISSATAQGDDDTESSGEYPELTTKNPVIYRMHVTSDITYRFATTQVTSLLANRDPVAREIMFQVTLPAAAFISNFTMEIEGKIYHSKVKGKVAAKKDYDKAKKKGESAGQVSAGKTTVTTTEFQVSVNVAAQSKVNFNLTYQELLQRRLGLYEHMINIKPGQVIRDLQVRVRILESRDLTLVKVPPLREANRIGTGGTNELAQINWDGGSNALITYSPTIEEQIASSQDGVSGQFVVQYDVQRDLDAGEIQVIDGYFVHYFAPTGLDPVPKNVLFILDVSGSMSGDKIEQTKEAMDTIITDLEEHDMFSIMIFESGITFWNKEQRLIPATLANVNRAKKFIRKMRADGGTNINDAVVMGTNFLKNQSDALGPDAGTRTNMIIFLTDGEPTSGVTNTETILSNARQANDDHVTLFSLGFGHGVDFPFLQKMSLQNRGLARRIYANADATLQLRGFYQEVSTPVLSEVQIQYLGDAIDEDSLTGSDFHTFFQGSELVVAGKLKNDDVSNILTQISAESATGDITLGIDVNVVDTERMLKGEDLTSFTERLWAYLSIKKLLDAMTEAVEPSAKEAARQKALDLSLKYGFVTPLTSMVVTKPNEPQQAQEVEDADGSRNPERAPKSKGKSGRKSYGRSAVDNDPHFLVNMRGVPEAVCFDVHGREGDVFQLVYDAETGIVANGQVVENDVTAKNPDEGHVRTYFGQIAIMRQNTTIVVTPNKIMINGQFHHWRDNVTVTGTDVTVSITRKKSVMVDFGDDVIFLVLRHKRKGSRPGKVDYLGFYIKDGRGMSHHAHGLIGQFQHRSVHVMHQDAPSSLAENGTPLVRLRVQGASWAGRQRMVEARLIQRRDMEQGQHVPCWFVRNSGRGLLDARHVDYVVPKLTTRRFAMGKRQRLGRMVSRLLL